MALSPGTMHMGCKTAVRWQQTAIQTPLQTALVGGEMTVPRMHRLGSFATALVTCKGNAATTLPTAARPLLSSRVATHLERQTHDRVPT